VQPTPDDRTVLRRWIERILADVENTDRAAPAQGQDGEHSPHAPSFDWTALVREAVTTYADRKPLAFLAALIRAIPRGQAVDLGPLSTELLAALLAHLRDSDAQAATKATDSEAQAAVRAVEQMLRWYRHNPRAG